MRILILSPMIIFLGLTTPTQATSLPEQDQLWAGEWKRADFNQPSTLVISDLNPKGFNFLIDASSGVNSGSADGRANFGSIHSEASAEILVEPTTESDKKTSPCRLGFSLSSETDPTTLCPTVTILHCY